MRFRVAEVEKMYIDLKGIAILPEAVFVAARQRRDIVDARKKKRISRTKFLRTIMSGL